MKSTRNPGNPRRFSTAVNINDFAVYYENGFMLRNKTNDFRDVFEIILSLTDGMAFLADAHYVVLNKWDILINDNYSLVLHVSQEVSTFNRYRIIFNPFLTESWSTNETDLISCFKQLQIGSNPRRSLPEALRKEFLALLERGRKNSSARGFGSDILRKSILAEILVLVNRTYLDTTGAEPPLPPREIERIMPVVGYIQEHLNERLGLYRIAEALHTNIYHLASVFRKVTGLTIHQYITRKRIICAKRHLRDGKPVEAAARAAGFTSPLHLRRCFDRLVGETPMVYGELRRPSS